MAKERSEEKKEKKEKKHRRSEDEGISKHKSEKKDKKDKKRAKEAAASAGSELDKENVAPASSTAAAADANEDTIMGDDEKPKPEVIIGASVPFANPMADDKAMRKVLRSVKKAAKHKAIRRGVKEVVKALRKSGTTASTPAHAVVVLAADISPFDVISHIPVLCEDHHVPYIFVPSRAELGAAGSTKRPTSVVMVVPNVAQKKKLEEKDGKEDKEDWSEVYSDLVKVVEKAGRNVRV